MTAKNTIERATFNDQLKAGEKARRVAWAKAYALWTWNDTGRRRTSHRLNTAGRVACNGTRAKQRKGAKAPAWIRICRHCKHHMYDAR